MLAPKVTLNPVLCGKWYFIKYDDHDMAKAVILTEEASNAVVDKVRALGKEDESSLKKLRKDKYRLYMF